MISIPKTRPRFQPGQLVHHRRYNYRGVVVAVDERCLADERWYQANRTQPNRNQPWYHVLVDGTDAVTYVAQSNIESDWVRAPIEHPLVPHFFSEFDDGHYVRNNRPWPGSQ